MKESTQHLMQYALDEKGKLVYIEDVINGLACNCVCPSCKGRLVAKQGTEKIAHFAHYDSEECKSGYQTMIHLLAKEIIAEEKKIIVPVMRYKGTIKDADDFYEDDFAIDKGTVYNIGYEGLQIGIFGKEEYKTIKLDEVVLEQKLGDIIPDIIGIVGDRKLLIEIYVTHKVDESKKTKIKDMGLSCIEIDLSHEEKELTKEKLKKSIYDVKNIKTIYNAREVINYKNALELFRKNNYQIKQIECKKSFYCNICGKSVKKYNGKFIAYKFHGQFFCYWCSKEVKNALYWGSPLEENKKLELV